MSQKQGGCKKIGRAGRGGSAARRKALRPDLNRKMKNLVRHGFSEIQLRDWCAMMSIKDPSSAGMILRYRDELIKSGKCRVERPFRN